jgi:hypothetical protein
MSYPIGACHTKYKSRDTVKEEKMRTITQIFINKIIDCKEDN